jgi:predicted transcriptional regulator
MDKEMKRVQDLYMQIVELYENGLRDQLELAKKLGVSQSTVSRYLSKWKRNIPVEDVRGRGKPLTFSPIERTVLGRIVTDNQLMSSSEITHKMLEVTGKTCPPRTIRNTLGKMSYANSIPRIVPLLTDAAKTRRVEWSHANTEQDWSHVFFSDETYIQLLANVTHAWHKIGERPFCPRPKFPKKLMFWAAVSSKMKTDLIVVDGTITSQ